MMTALISICNQNNHVFNCAGDTPDSYAYDGNRLRKWNQSTAPYGETWQNGDIIGCCIDLDEGKIEFYRYRKLENFTTDFQLLQFHSQTFHFVVQKWEVVGSGLHRYTPRCRNRLFSCSQFSIQRKYCGKFWSHAASICCTWILTFAASTFS